MEKYEQIFNGYSCAWNDSWSNVMRFGCIKFSSDYNSLRMSHNVPVSFSLPNELDEGNCPLSLIHYLIEKHNTFAQRVDEALLLRSRQSKLGNNVIDDEQIIIERVPLISSRFMTTAHTIRCDIEHDFIPLLEMHCMTNDDKTGSIAYDFMKAENLIIDRFLADIPAIDLEMPGFRFSHEQHLQGGLSMLRQKIKQISLPQDIIRNIQREINTPANAQYLLELIEQVISFVSATGGSIVQTLSENVGEMFLGKYIRSVLLIEDELRSRVISQQVQLKHLESIWNILTDMTNCDPFSNVNDVYKSSLSSRSRYELEKVLKNPNFKSAKILSILKSFITENLQERTIAPSTSIYICLVNLEVDGIYLGDIDWFVDIFPQDIPMSEIVDTFEVIKEAQEI